MGKQTTPNDEEEVEIIPVGPNVDDDSDDSGDSGDSDDEAAKAASKVDDSDDSENGDNEDEDAGHVENRADDESDDDDGKPKKKTRHQRQKEARDRDKREMAYLRIRNEQLEQRFGAIEARTIQNEALAIDQRLGSLREQLRVAEEVIAEATTQGKSADVAEARRIEKQLTDQINRLTHARHQVDQAMQTVEQGGTAMPTGPDPAVVMQARAWMAANSWYQPDNARDADSQRVRRIDSQLVREGYDPTDSEYWDELTARAERALPHRFDGADDEDEEIQTHQKSKPKKRSNGGPQFTTRGREVSLKSNQVYITPARKAAMIEAGVWDDPQVRQRYLKQYAKYDREHANRA